MVLFSKTEKIAPESLAEVCSDDRLLSFEIGGWWKKETSIKEEY